MAGGHQVFCLTLSLQTAQRVRRAGAVPVMGDLLEPGQWQDEVAADWVFHGPPHSVWRPRMTRRRAASITRARVSMDAHLLDAWREGRRGGLFTSRTRAFTAQRARARSPRTNRLGPRPGHACFAPALDRLDGYVVAGLPIVTAFPGWVFGNAPWLRERVIEPVVAGRRVLQFGKTGPWVSPIHVHDCAPALVHLARTAKPAVDIFS
ncbi:MAG: hypothetical protein ABJA98_09525 [Acidobacteriota bacterium]